MAYARGMLHWILALVINVAHAACAPALSAGDEPRLPKIGPAPLFTLIDQDEKRFAMGDVRGRVVVVTFIFTTCSSTCPLLTAKLVEIQRRLGPDKARVLFAAITVDPLNDTPTVLKKYAKSQSVDPAYFVFVTGSPREVEDVARRYAVYLKRSETGSLDHTFLTSIVDPAGVLRVQYLGTRFDLAEFHADLKSLLAERQRK